MFIYLHLWVPSESMGGAFLICPIRISKSPKRSLEQVWEDEGMFLVFQEKWSCFLTALVASGNMSSSCFRRMSWNLSHHEAQHWGSLGYCQSRKWPQKLKQQKTPRVSDGHSQLENSQLKNSPTASIQKVTGWVALVSHFSPAKSIRSKGNQDHNMLNFEKTNY